VNWGKIDAPLASALAGAADDHPLSVFVHLDRSRADDDVLDRLGLGLDVGDVGTASLSPADLADLTDQAWVRRVSLSGRLRLLDEPERAARQESRRARRNPP